MKTILTIMMIFLTMGCSVRPVEIVTIDKPIPVCPVPPPVPEYEYWVDDLTSNDFNDPGKVGQAYKHDMIYLRKRVEIDNMILEQYRTVSENYDEAEKTINNAFRGL